MNFWIEHCEPPRQRPAGIEWDVFISYRSLDRVWAMALYDMLKQCGYQVFLDQFVLVAGQGLNVQLGKNLSKSASGVLIWSKNTSDSVWVENEIDAMVARKNDTVSSSFPFYFIVASLDSLKPQGLQGGQIYLDFSTYPDGPMGADLVRLTSGLIGKPLSPDAVSRVVMFDNTMKEEPAKLRALATTQRFDTILDRIKSDDPAYTTSATLSGVAIDLLIRGKKYEDAIQAADFAMKRFPQSIRIQQLRGLALRRFKNIEEALYQMSLLVENGHRDTETLGILAAIWADIWEQRSRNGEVSEARDALENSFNFYEEGFTKVPTDTYTGINASSKSALLGRMEEAVILAKQVYAQIKEKEQKRGGVPSSDFWERVTEAEALLIIGEWQQSYELYHDARIAHQHEKGSIESTAIQLRRLLRVLSIPEEIIKKLSDEFKLQS